MPRTGRPREFDKEAAIGQAMRLFWEHGYEATSLSQLKAAMGGISPASFYAAFGSKDALFHAALDLYLETYGQVVRPLRDPSLTPREAIETTLLLSARMQTELTHPSGCLVTLAATTLSPENHAIRDRLARERAGNRALFQACVERAVQRGELPDTATARALPALFDTFLSGLATQARDGVTTQALEAAIGSLMRIWDVAASGKAANGSTRARRAEMHA